MARKKNKTEQGQSVDEAARLKEGDIVVDPETYLQLQLATIDNDIALAEIQVADAQLEVAKAKQRKSQTIIDFNIDQLKKRQAEDAKNNEKPVEKSAEATIETPVVNAQPTMNRAARRQRKKMRLK